VTKEEITFGSYGNRLKLPKTFIVNIAINSKPNLSTENTHNIPSRYLPISQV
jgi:hypothetical protein